MKNKFIVIGYISIMAIIFGCVKDEINPNSLESVLETTESVPQSVDSDLSTVQLLAEFNLNIQSRSGAKYPVFHDSTMSTNSYLITDELNKQYCFGMDSLSHVKLVRHTEEIVNYANGILLGVYNVTFVFLNGESISIICFARNGADTYVLYPNGGINQVKGYNYALVTRQVEFEWYYDFLYQKMKRRYFYRVILDGTIMTYYINGSSANHSDFSFKHLFRT